MAETRAQANAVENSLVQASRTREMLAQERLNKLRAKAQRELARAASQAALGDTLQRKREMIHEMKAEQDRRTGRDVALRMESVPFPDEAEVKALSTIFNKALIKLYPHPDGRSFYKLFQAMDLDGSKRISFAELEKMVRLPTNLNLDRKALSEERLVSLWKLLDLDGSGYIDAGELSRFTKIGRNDPIGMSLTHCRSAISAHRWPGSAYSTLSPRSGALYCLRAICAVCAVGVLQVRLRS